MKNDLYKNLSLNIAYLNQHLWSDTSASSIGSNFKIESIVHETLQVNKTTSIKTRNPIKSFQEIVTELVQTEEQRN